MMKIYTAPDAEAELNEAIEWYERQREGLGAEFLAEVRAATRAIAETPERFAQLETMPEEPSIRRLIMDRFPYLIVFELCAEEIRILAIAHAHRRPNYWRDVLGR